jgi:hypothetical protein
MEIGDFYSTVSCLLKTREGKESEGRAYVGQEAKCDVSREYRWMVMRVQGDTGASVLKGVFYIQSRAIAHKSLWWLYCHHFEI